MSKRRPKRDDDPGTFGDHDERDGRIPLSLSDKARSTLDPDPDPVEAPPADEGHMSGAYDPIELARHRLLWAIERRAAQGHCLAVDKGLLTDAASLIRNLLGLAPDDPLLFPPARTVR